MMASAKAETCCLFNKHSKFFISCVFDSTTYDSLSIYWVTSKDTLQVTTHCVAYMKTFFEESVWTAPEK
jgi:hypothetical protein